MKIGLITSGGFDRTGTERVIPVFLDLAGQLTQNHEVYVYTSRQQPEPDTFTLRGATVHNVGYDPVHRRPLSGLRRTLRALRTEHRRAPFDVLHGLWANECGVTAALAGRLLGVRSVVTVSGGELMALPEIGYGGQLSLGNRWTAATSLRLADAVTTASASMLTRVQARRPDARQIVMGVDCEQFVRRPDRPTASNSQSTRHLLHVANLNRVKDQPTLLKAFALLRRAEPLAHLDIVGVDTMNGAIQQAAEELALQGAVTFHGFRPSSEVAAMLQQSNLLLHSSRSEVGPIVFLEAAAVGIPTVGTAVGLIADCAPHSATAVPIADAEALGEAALMLLRDAERWETLSTNAHAFAQQHNAAWTATQFERLYEESALRNR